MKKGTLNVVIDELTSCLVRVSSGEKVRTVVRKILHKSELKGYNKKTGWQINWEKQMDGREIYALQVADSFEIEGLASVRFDEEASTVSLEWAVANPHSNPLLCKEKGVQKEYSGIGGHLFAIAVQVSIDHGCDGVIVGYPANRKLVDHYVKELGCEVFPFTNGHAYAVVLWENAAQRIREVYDYEYLG